MTIIITDKQKTLNSLYTEREFLSKEALKNNDRLKELIHRYEYDMKMLSNYQEDLLLKMIQIDLDIRELENN